MKLFGPQRELGYPPGSDGPLVPRIAALCVCVLTLTAGAYADYGTGDSADFSVNVLTIPMGGTGGFADSVDFVLDAHGVNRGWGDSGTFAFSDAPPPAPVLTLIDAPSTVAPNAPFEIRVTVRNNGGPGNLGGISISFPELAAPDPNTPPYDSVIADVAIGAETTFATVGFYDAGDPIDINGTMGPAQHLLVEGEEDGWTYGETQTLALTVTPKQVGSFCLRVRAWIVAGTGQGSPVYRYPDQAGVGYEQDQQGYWSQVIEAPVSVSLLPGSIRAIRADYLLALGLGGVGVKIGMVGSAAASESGLPWTGHPALQANLLNGDPNQQHASDHETGVAGIMVGVDPGAGIAPDGWGYQGLAPNSTLAASEVPAPAWPWDNIDNAMIELRDAGCILINYSGGFDPTDPQGGAFVAEINRTIDDMVDDDKITIVCAAGNTSENGPDPDTIACPANAYNVIAVGSLGALENGGDRIHGPWNTTSAENIPGPTAGLYAPGRCKPDLVAPGDCTIPTTSANVYANDGTGSSLAAPHVAGATALLIEAARAAGAYFVEPGGRVDPRVIKSALLTGANKSVQTRAGVRPDPNWQTDGPIQPLDHHLGAGGLDAFEAEKVLLGEDGPTATRHMAYDTITWAEALEMPQCL